MGVCIEDTIVCYMCIDQHQILIYITFMMDSIHIILAC